MLLVGAAERLGSETYRPKQVLTFSLDCVQRWQVKIEKPSRVYVRAVGLSQSRLGMRTKRLDANCVLLNYSQLVKWNHVKQLLLEPPSGASSISTSA